MVAGEGGGNSQRVKQKNGRKVGEKEEIRNTFLGGKIFHIVKGFLGFPLLYL